MVHPNDRAGVDAAVQAALDGADEFVFVARVMGGDDWVWTRGRGVCVRDDAGTPVLISGTHQDITEAKLSEEALEDAFAQNALLQAVAVAANESRRLEDVLAHARSLVLLHDDWERARGFLPAPDGQRRRRAARLRGGPGRRRRDPRDVRARSSSWPPARSVSAPPSGTTPA